MNFPPRFSLQEWGEKFSAYISSGFKRLKKGGESRTAKATE